MIRIFFGNPGCGKTTCMVRNMKKMQKYPKTLHYKLCNLPVFSLFFHYKYPMIDDYYSNFDSVLSDNITLKDLGKWTLPEHSYLCVDESGIEYNSRKYKSLPQETIAWYKLYRHYKVDIIDFVSQSWEDMDVTIRRLIDELWYLRKLGPFTLVRRIYKWTGIDNETHQITDMYKFGSFFRRILPPPFHRKDWYVVFRPFHYKQFNSYERYYLPTYEEWREMQKTDK